jgi:hypothetical protein
MNVTKDRRVIAPCSDYAGAERAVEDLSGRGFALTGMPRSRTWPSSCSAMSCRRAAAIKPASEPQEYRT